jgi:putative lipoprotein
VPTPEPTPIVVPTLLPSASPLAAPSVSGTVILPEGATLPADALVRVELLDISRADAPATVIAVQELSAAGLADAGIPFAVEYDPASILEESVYSLGVRIEDAAGAPLFVAGTVVPVITGGNPTEGLEIPVIQVEGAVDPVASEVPMATGALASPSA